MHLDPYAQLTISFASGLFIVPRPLKYRLNLHRYFFNSASGHWAILFVLFDIVT